LCGTKAAAAAAGAVNKYKGQPALLWHMLDPLVATQIDALWFATRKLLLYIYYNIVVLKHYYTAAAAVLICNSFDGFYSSSTIYLEEVKALSCVVIRHIAVVDNVAVVGAAFKGVTHCNMVAFLMDRLYIYIRT
jgi:hypothetical protein